MKKGTCIHYTGILGRRQACCKAGVNYDEAFDGKRPGIMLRIPCVQYMIMPAHGRGTHAKPGEPTVCKEFDRRGESMVPCPHFQEPTDEEVERDRQETEAAINRHIAAIQVASEWRVKQMPKQDRNEIIECPICKGKLHLFQSAYNGHVHGKCETAGCVSWME